MAEGTNWIANAFKVLDAFIHRGRPPTDRSAKPASQEPTVEAPVGSPRTSIRCVEPAPETNALPGQVEGAIETPPSQEAKALPVQQDDESRRNLIRQLFNEYWTGVEDKPPTFAERLEIAEGYINERLADRDVGWRLDAVTRNELGLPSSSITG
jgi:hypothetical protein